MRQNYELLEVYVVHETVDEFGRSGRMVGVFDIESQAKRAAKEQGYYGSDASVQNRYAIKVDGKVWLLEQLSPVELNVNAIQRDDDDRKAALSKLSERERKLLGIK